MCTAGSTVPARVVSDDLSSASGVARPRGSTAHDAVARSRASQPSWSSREK
jgi:hypothetical protein